MRQVARFQIGVWVYGREQQASRSDSLDGSLLTNEKLLKPNREKLCYQMVEVTES